MSTEFPHRGNGRFLERVDAMNLPIGVYAVDREGRFLACNATARRILALPAEGPLAGSLADLHVDVDRHAERIAETERAETEGGCYEKAVLHLRVAERDIFIDDYLRPERDPETGELLGFVGCLVDVTEEHLAAQRGFDLQQKVEDLTLDIGRILHANTSTLLMVNQTLGAADAALDPGPDTSEAAGSPQDRVPKLAVSLAQAVEKLVTSGDAARRLEALPRERWTMLENQVGLLRDYESRIPVAEMRNPALRACVTEIARTCRGIAPHQLPREPIRETLRLALELQRLLCYLDVQMTRTSVVQMDFTLRALRDFITAEVRLPERPVRLSVASLVQESIAQLAEFARVSNVEIVWRRCSGLAVRGSERDLVRAISNLLHNAIKYSWKRDRSNAPWVAIRTEAHTDGMVVLELESWGVPITPDEIEQGLIYQMGYRGKWSTDRGRLGTGIGLTDAQRVARTHGGDLRVESKPAQSTALSPDDAAYYRHPFITRVTLLLPLVD